MASIVFDRVEFHYQDPFQDVFAGLDLVIETSWRTALVGRNGRGKTTLLRLIAGELKPTGGGSQPGRSAALPGEPRDPSRPTLEVVRGAIAPFDEWRREMEELAGGFASLGGDAPGANAPSAEALARWSSSRHGSRRPAAGTSTRASSASWRCSASIPPCSSARSDPVRRRADACADRRALSRARHLRADRRADQPPRPAWA